MSIAKIEVLEKIAASGLVAVIRAQSPDQATRIAEACAQGALPPWKLPSPQLAKQFVDRIKQARARAS
jgi:2-keto-3-deoxy-6-phosphogluconate aldolase